MSPCRIKTRLTSLASLFRESAPQPSSVSLKKAPKSPFSTFLAKKKARML
jgi:hypothetical protein